MNCVSISISHIYTGVCIYVVSTSGILSTAILVASHRINAVLNNIIKYSVHLDRIDYL